ncbi:MAG: hypothetical protein WED09_05250 [Homoserinimonas sp.]
MSYTEQDRARDYAALKLESDRLEREGNLTDDNRPAGTVTNHQARLILDDKKAGDETTREGKADSRTASEQQAAALGFDDGASS